MVSGRSVSFSVSASEQPQKRFRIRHAFTSEELGLSSHSHPVRALKRIYRHLRGLPLQSFSQAQPLLLIGSDYPHLLTPVEPVRLGPLGAPAALKTSLGWTLQGPAKVLMHQHSTARCLFTSPAAELSQDPVRADANSWESKKLPAAGNCRSYQELLETSIRACHGAATLKDPTAGDFKQERHGTALLHKVQMDIFPEDLTLLSTGKPVSATGRLITLAPEFKTTGKLIRVGGRLRRCKPPEE